uniref:Cytochrome c biogenesis protein CcsA n=1 Tax=Olisthodiscus luteus TaxID=83000 RepID=A0A7U0KT00_OLILU|nr:heme attachment to plastid cytochrome c [Olisthodiscus luteus]QQW50475.1 heme attachment to plastid cytochrome c [Olisthodiscus luteus]
MLFERTILNVIFISLIILMFAYWFQLIFIKKTKNVWTFPMVGTLLVNGSLFVVLLVRWIKAKYFPLSNLYESLLFLSWILLFLQTLLEYKTKSKILGAIIIPIVLLINGFANLTLPIEMQKASSLVPALQSNWLIMHVSMMMLSYGTLIVGSLLSILFLFLAQKKKLPVPTSNISTPNGKLEFLNQLDIWSYRIIGLGFPFLTIGIISGAVWANEAWGSYWSWDPKETWALITWLTFAIYLHGRLTKSWKGEKTAIIGSVGFIVVWICYLGVNFLGQGLHSYGWIS